VDNNEKKNFKSTLHLPTTSFAMRPSPATDDPALVSAWEQAGLFEAVRTINKEKTSFVLHFGPPYANGTIHSGHALTEVLKDFVAKAKRMEGFFAPLVPGSDCHGLPIEFKVMQEEKMTKEEAAANPERVKALCRAYASKWIDAQKKEFKQLGILASWETPYITMDFEYEATIVRSLASLVEKGHVERKGKAVPWCMHCQTVLASAEIEYKDRKDPSTYILFPADAALKEKVGVDFIDKELSVVIWTTTPWTIPLNRAVLFHPEFEYELVQMNESTYFIMSSDARVALSKALESELKTIKKIKGSEFIGHFVQHPITSRSTPLIEDLSVEAGSGTSFVHCAPGCGPEDYLVGVKHKLEIFSPVSAAGTYTEKVGVDWLTGISVTDGQWAVLKWLKENGFLLHKDSLMHSYPHCWRCHQGLIFRATEQWFCNLEKNNLIDKTVAAVEEIRFIPEWGKSRFLSFIKGRAEWCISRQRQWGVPIPVLHDLQTNEYYLSADFIRAIAAGVEKEGIEYWDRVTIDQLHQEGLIPEAWYQRTDAAGNCRLVKEKDILDVWFDSGVSHAAVLEKDADLTMPADLYLEGSDQHRGWFQSSILTSMIMHDRPPMKQILTHGFVVDSERHKMSKSVGNVISPDEVIKKYGVDVLRLWVASVDYERDVVISFSLLDAIAETYRKIRNTARFMLSNLFDFDIQKDAIPLKDLRLIDQIALARLHEVIASIRSSYEEYRFTGAVQELQAYCVNDLSAWYLDLVKDILYTGAQNGHARRSAQTTLYHILDALTHAMAPVLSFTSEYIYKTYTPQATRSIHENQFVTPENIWKLLDKDLEVMKKSLIALDRLRAVILKAIEQQREQGLIKHSLEASVTVALTDASWSNELQPLFEMVADKDLFLKDLCIVSQAKLVQKIEDAQMIDEVQVLVVHAEGVKCPRCWQWDLSENVDQLCRRCTSILC
jgi:isoleucyl-tRNA synthetase